MLMLLRRVSAVFVLLTLLTGVVYPLMVTAFAQLAFPAAASGSLIERAGRPSGSSLLGQPFSDPKYFWGRPSATSPQPYNAAASAGSNQSATNPAWLRAVEARVRSLRAADSGNARPIPVDLVTASASGLDPHISPAAAGYQIERVARTRGLDVPFVAALVAAHTEGRSFGLLGEPRVDVLELNLALDATTD